MQQPAIILILRRSNPHHHTLAASYEEDSKNMNGLRVKRHLLCNACGDVAPACYCFSGLSEWEMPEDDFIIWEIEGLCIGGYGAHRSTGVGYVLFMRGTPGAEKRDSNGLEKIYCFHLSTGVGRSTMILMLIAVHQWVTNLQL
jgi:hypothetical protein